jgi:hypothetical protein
MSRDDQLADPEAAGCAAWGKGASHADFPQYLKVNDKLAWQQGWRNAEMRHRLRETIARQDAERGRPLTNVERLTNLRRRLDEDAATDGAPVA